MGPSKRITIDMPWELYVWLKAKGEREMAPYVVATLERAKEEEK